MEEVKEKSCGCIIIDEGKVLLIKHTVGHWSFPKGHVEENEAEEETAIREVKEETNLDVAILDKERYRYTEQYTGDKNNLKEVVYFLAKKVDGIIKPQEEEVSEVKWLTFEDALKTITYDSTKELFEKVINDLKVKVKK